MTRGIFYIATGEKYVNEAARSAESVRTNTDICNISILSDLEVSQDVFDKVITVSDVNYDYGDKVSYIGETPYDKTIFLDTDTYVMRDLSDLFKLLDNFDLAISHSPVREPLSLDIPFAFPEHNTGVIVYNRDKCAPLFSDWKEAYDDLNVRRDIKKNQPSFRLALFHSDVRFTTLPEEYNCRGYEGFLDGDVAILHTDSNQIQKLGQELNSANGPRVYIRRGNSAAVYSSKPTWKMKLKRQLNKSSLIKWGHNLKKRYY